jgi:tetratricopeptide (TPR) repeat protein
MSKFIRWALPLALLLLLAVADTGCTAKLKAQYHQKRADHYYDAGQYDQAEIEYKNVLRSAPQNAQAWARLGLIYFDQGRAGESSQILDRAAQMAPDNLQVRLKLGVIYLGMGKIKEARDEAGFVLEKDPRDAQAPLLLAEASVNTNEINTTRLRLQKLSSSGDTAPLEVALGSLSIREHDLKAAETCFQTGVRLDPKFADAYSALGNLYLAKKDAKQADQAFEKAMELSPLRSGKTLFYSKFKILTGDPDTAKKILQDLVKRAPDYLPAWIALAQLAGTTKDFAGGLTLLGNVFSRDPRNPEALLLKASLEMEQGDTGQAIKDLQSMVRYFPKMPMGFFQLARAQAATNQFDNAVGNLNQALKLNPNFDEAIMLLAEIQVYTGNTEPAIVSLQQLIRRQPQFVPARFLLARAYSDHGRLDDAVLTYRDLERAFPTNSQIHLLLGKTLLLQSKNAEARAEFDQALKLVPNYLPALQEQVNLDLREKRYDSAQQRLQQQIAQNPKSVPLQLLLAQVQIAGGETNQAESTLTNAIALSPDHQPDLQPAYLMLARLYIAANQNQKALLYLSAALAKNPDDASVLLLMGMTYSAEKNFPDARDTYEKLLALDTNSVVVLNNLACLYSQNLGQIDKGFQLARRAHELAPTDPYVADTFGWILYQQGRFSSALSPLQEGAAKMDSDPEVRFHLGKTYYMMGDEANARATFQQALQLSQDFPEHDECKQCLAVLDIDPNAAGADTRAWLEKRLASQPKDTVAQLRLAAIYRREGSPDKAIVAYEAALQASPQNVIALVNLAGLVATNDPQKAFNLAKQAYDLTPNDPTVTHTMARLAFLTSDYAWSLNLLQLTARNQPSDPEVLYDLGQAYYSVGGVSEAKSAMQGALRASSVFPRAEDAKRFLDMIGLADKPAQVLAAQSQVADILKSAPDFVPALMVKAAISEQKADLTTAQQTYEAILNHYPDFSPAQRKLVLLYVIDPKNDSKASPLAVKARQAFPDDPEVAKALGLVVYRQGDYSRAASLFAESARRLNHDAELMYYLGLAQYQLKNRTPAKTALQQALDLNLSGTQATDAKRMLAELK